METGVKRGLCVTTCVSCVCVCVWMFVFVDKSQSELKRGRERERERDGSILYGISTFDWILSVHRIGKRTVGLCVFLLFVQTTEEG